MMHRNDFVTMFGMLPEPVQVILRANHQTFVDSIIFALMGNMDLSYMENADATNPAEHRDMQVADRFFLDNKFKSKFFADEILPNMANTASGLKQVSYGVIPDMTVQRWIRGWLSGEAPVDMMTEAEFAGAASREVNPEAPMTAALTQVRAALSPQIAAIIDWEASYVEGSQARLKFDYAQLTPEQRQILNYHARGLGGLGDETDNEDGENLALFENRIMGPVDNERNNLPTQVPMDLATESILSYFEGMMMLIGPAED